MFFGDGEWIDLQWITCFDKLLQLLFYNIGWSVESRLWDWSCYHEYPGVIIILFYIMVVMVGLTSKPKGFEAINIDLLQDWSIKGLKSILEFAERSKV